MILVNMVLVRAILPWDDFGKSKELLRIFNRWCVFGIQTCITHIMLLNTINKFLSSVKWNRLQPVDPSAMQYVQET